MTRKHPRNFLVELTNRIVKPLDLGGKDFDILCIWTDNILLADHRFQCSNLLDPVINCLLVIAKVLAQSPGVSPLLRYYTGHTLFAELEVLSEAKELAEGGDVHCVTRYRSKESNLRTQLHRIIKRAGLSPWPRVFQNLRSTRVTELCDKFPEHVCEAWLGHSEVIAKRHYRQVTEKHFEKAIAAGSDADICGQKSGQTVAARSRQETTISPIEPVAYGRKPFLAKCLRHKKKVLPEGLEKAAISG